MPLSEREQRMLRELESQLQSEDPSFASSLSQVPSGRLNVRHLILGILVAIVGIGVLIFGIYQQWIPVGILGFLVMGAGVYFATTGGPSGRRSSGRGGAGGGNGGSGGSGPQPPAPSPSGGSFMTSLEQKWEQRRQQ